jgi:PadR family transcriptional regulator PadR
MRELSKWKTQIRKGYLDLCILAIIEAQGRVYGLDLVERLKRAGLEVKEGTLYPLLNRLNLEGLLKSEWEFKDDNRGHPRKFYSLTPMGKNLYRGMIEEFESMYALLGKLEPYDSELST